jgi:hypothetical protein
MRRIIVAMCLSVILMGGFVVRAYTHVTIHPGIDQSPGSKFGTVAVEEQRFPLPLFAPGGSTQYADPGPPPQSAPGDCGQC